MKMIHDQNGIEWEVFRIRPFKSPLLIDKAHLAARLNLVIARPGFIKTIHYYNEQIMLSRGGWRLEGE